MEALRLSADVAACMEPGPLCKENLVSELPPLLAHDDFKTLPHIYGRRKYSV
jgi:hypothetical protein